VLVAGIPEHYANVLDYILCSNALSRTGRAERI
jgi:hypothetical protein